MNKEFIINKYNDIVDEVKDYVKNKNYPLDDRWEVFTELDLGNYKYNCLELNCVGLHDFYLNYCEKYETVYISQIMEYIEDEYPDKESEAKEEILELFINKCFCDF